MKLRSIVPYILLIAGHALPFKISTHAATANQVIDDLTAQVQQGSGTYSIRFRGLDLQVSVKDGYDAILAHPDFFRAGSIGPDAFPDMVTGQMYEHTNNGLASEGSDHRTTEQTYETRYNTNQYRAIDYGMRLLTQARESQSASNLAFALGYLSHISGDGFAHAWVNQQAKGAWSYTDGSGVFGPLSEEIKHVATEGIIDQSTPDRLLSPHPRVDGKSDYARMTMAAPYDLLDHLYSEEMQGQPLGGNLYKYFSFQKSIIDDIESGTNANLNILESVTDGPGSPTSISWLMGRIPGMDALRSITGYNPAEGIAQLFFDDNPVFDPAGWYLDQVRDNMRNLDASIDVYRRNWEVMSHCTSENVLKASAFGNADRCVELGTDQYLTYPGMSGANRDLLKREMTENFALGANSDHHKLGDNVERAAGYLVNGFRLKNLPETLVPADLRKGWADLEDWLRNNDDILVDIVLYPVATAAAQAVCIAEGGWCETHCITNQCSMKILRCIPDREEWCDEYFCHDIPLIGTICDPLYLVCLAGATTFCAAEGVVGCAGCQADCVWDFAGCTAGNIFNFNSSRKLADAVDDILAPLDAIKAYAVDYMQRRACDIGKEIGLPIADVHRVVGIYKTIDQLEEQGRYGFANFAFLQEDLKDDAWMATLSQGSNQLHDLFVSIRDGQYRFIGDELSTLPIDVPPNCFQFSTNGAFYKDANFGLILSASALFTEKGPTVSHMLDEIGSNMPQTFVPFYNTTQLMKLLPMQDASDVDRLFAQQNANASYLPWNAEGNAIYSQICQDRAKINILCDAVASLDDPDAYARTSTELNAKQYSGSTGPIWYWGRSVTPGNKYDPEAVGWKPYVNTPFLLATTDDVVEKLYKKIFIMENALPGWMGLDAASDLWSVAAPAEVELDPVLSTQGTSSMKVTGCGFMTLQSPRAKTTDFGVYSDKLSMDVWIPSPQVNPYWQGAMQLTVDLHAAGMYDAYVGQVDLTGLPTNAWSKITFTLPGNLIQALSMDLPGLNFKVSLNVTCGNDPFRVDNLRFEDPVTVRTAPHTEGSRGQIVSTGDLMGFESAADWNRGTAQVAAYSGRVVQGAGALKIASGGWNTVVSRNFATSEIPAVSATSSFDLFVPNPQSNQWWVGTASLVFNCPSAGLNNVQIGVADLTKLFWGEYNQIKFNVSPAVQAALLGDHQDASWTFALNTNAPGDFALDNFGFIGPTTIRNPMPPDPPAGFACTGACLSARPLLVHASLDGTDETWFVTSQDIHGWTATEMDGRSISVNGVTVSPGEIPLPPKVDGKYYFRVTQGGKSWASLTLW